MARDWLQIVRRIEAAYPQARGGANYDDELRKMLVPWVNDLIYELGQMQRWSFEYKVYTLLTTANQAVYSFSDFSPSAVNLTAIKRMYYIDSAGYPREVDRRERFEASRLLGDTLLPRANAVPPGSPRQWSINDGQEIEIFPPPDTAGFDSGGNYKLVIQGYELMKPIVEVTSTTTVAPPGLSVTTVPSGPYLTSNGVSTSGTGVSIRSGGPLQFSATRDDYVSNWSAIATNAVSLTSATSLAVTDAPTYFNSQPWIITWWPKLVEFGVLREVATYLKDLQAYQMYEQRYNNELTQLRAYEFDRMRGVEMKGAAHGGQNIPVDRRIDVPIGLDVRGVI